MKLHLRNLRHASLAAWSGVALLIAGAIATPVFAEDAAQLELGKQLFTQDAVPTCATCHTLADADASGPIGPDLDELQPSREQVLAALRDGVGVMPSYADSLSEEQMEAVAAYVVAATGD